MNANVQSRADGQNLDGRENLQFGATEQRDGVQVRASDTQSAVGKKLPEPWRRRPRITTDRELPRSLRQKLASHGHKSVRFMRSAEVDDCGNYGRDTAYSLFTGGDIDVSRRVSRAGDDFAEDQRRRFPGR